MSLAANHIGISHLDFVSLFSVSQANPVPVFTTLSHPGAELSDAASMAYSSIMQHAGPQREFTLKMLP